MGEGGAQFFDEGVVASLDASQAAMDIWIVTSVLSHSWTES